VQQRERAEKSFCAPVLRPWPQYRLCVTCTVPYICEVNGKLLSDCCL